MLTRLPIGILFPRIQNRGRRYVFLNGFGEAFSGNLVYSFRNHRRSCSEQMEDIKDVKVEPMPSNSEFLKPLRMTFLQNGRKRIWDFSKVHDSVSCVLFNTSRNKLLFVKQFRPAVYHSGAMQFTGDNSVQDVDWTKVSPKLGLTVELCAGIVDAKIGLNEIIRKEVIEECGYDVPLQNFEHVKTFRSGIGNSGDKQSIFYAECTDDMKVSEGGGNPNEGELIDVVEMSIPEVREFMKQNYAPSPGGLLFALMWFLANKAPKDC